MNLQKLNKHEVCMALAALEGAPGTEPFTTEYENYYEDWLAGYTFVKMLGPNEALYLLGINDDEGPSPYEGVCAGFLHVHVAEGRPVGRWGEWNC